MQSEGWLSALQCLGSRAWESTKVRLYFIGDFCFADKISNKPFLGNMASMSGGDDNLYLEARSRLKVNLMSQLV